MCLGVAKAALAVVEARFQPLPHRAKRQDAASTSPRSVAVFSKEKLCGMERKSSPARNAERSSSRFGASFWNVVASAPNLECCDLSQLCGERRLVAAAGIRVPRTPPL